MISVLTKFKNSSVWDKTYDLPMIPGLNNPFFYLALCTKFYRACTNNPSVVFEGADKYIAKCRFGPGVFDRRPDGSGGVMSHDELIGIAYLSSFDAAGIASIIWIKEGVYNNKNPYDDSERYNLYRFPWFIAYLRARAKSRIGLLSQLSYTIHLLLDSRDTGLDHADGKLMNWLMNEEMEKYWLCKWAINLWKKKMKAANQSVSMWFFAHLPGHPFLADFSKDIVL